MKIFGFEIKRAQKKRQKRSFAAANSGNLYSSWIANNSVADIDSFKTHRVV